MNRAFTNREKILMLILAVLLLGCFYYLVVLKPSWDTIALADSRYASTQDDIAVQQVIAVKKAQLEQQIEEAKAAGDSQKELPLYDNTKNEITALNTILTGTGSYTINFAQAEFSDSLVRRSVSISFTSDSYSAAQVVLNKLINCPYTCLVTDITISAGSAGSSGSTSSGTIASTATVTFFEKIQ